MTYQKVRFSSPTGATAGLVLRTADLRNKTVADISRLFSYSEARFMRRLEVSPEFATWAEAFGHDFSAVR